MTKDEMRLCAAAERLGAAESMALLADLILRGKSDQRVIPFVTIADIQRATADHYGIPMREMVSARRSWSVSRPRQVPMYLAKQLTPRSLPEIGRRFGGRDHTTVIHGIKQTEKRRAEDADLDRDVRILTAALAPAAAEQPVRQGDH